MAANIPPDNSNSNNHDLQPPNLDPTTAPTPANAGAAAAEVDSAAAAAIGAEANNGDSSAMSTFEPLFTLITNATTNTTIHPRVHYLFADDDPSILPGPAPPDPTHRAVVLDLVPASEAGDGAEQGSSGSGWAVAWASSLSPGFAGIPNPLFAAENTLMYFADGKKAILDLIAAVKEG